MNFVKIFGDNDDCKKNLENNNLSLTKFREEIETIKKECNNGLTLASVKGVPEVKTDNLNKEDMLVWEKFKADKLNLEELERYRNNIDVDNYDRRAFANFLIQEILKNKENGKKVKKI